MIAVDTSSLIAFFSGEEGDDVEAVDHAMETKQVVLPPVVLTEILSDPKLKPELSDLLDQIPLIEIKEGYWMRAGKIRSKVLAKGHKARIADSLIAQSCLDHDIALISRDKDFRHFAKLCGLRLL